MVEPTVCRTGVLVQAGLSLGFEEAVSARSDRRHPIRFVHCGEKGMARPRFLSRGGCDVADGDAVRCRATAGPTMSRRKALHLPLVCGTWPCPAEHGAPAVRRGAIQPGRLLRHQVLSTARPYVDPLATIWSNGLARRSTRDRRRGNRSVLSCCHVPRGRPRRRAGRGTVAPCAARSHSVRRRLLR